MSQTHMSSDAELLRRYVAERSEAAFTELVHRHIGLVYASALRRVGRDPQLAEDVAQKVFADLARKSASLTGHATLAGWLYVSTHHACAEIVRSERRRKAREQEAHAMQTVTSSDPTAAPDWERLHPVLDDLICKLKTEDREAILLRFFERRSFAEIGAVLRLTDEAARKRVDRSLEKLRAALAKRGVTSTAAALGMALAAADVVSAPTGLPAKVAQAALAPTAGSGGAGVLTFIGSGFIAAGLALVGGAWLIGQQYRVNRQLETELSRLVADTRTVAVLRGENQSLARAAAEADELRQLQAGLPALRAALASPRSIEAAPPPPLPRSVVTVRPDGRLTWDGKPVSLDDFIVRLKALQEATPDGASRVDISGLSAFSSLAYVVDEVRKAGVKHVVVESDAQPDSERGSWFGR